MLILKSIIELQNFQSSLAKNEVLGLVPTMGALHQGHLALLHKAQENSTKTIVSIFVNPLQFNNSNDFDKYPIKTHEDIALLERAGCDAVFMPSANEIYQSTPTLSFDFGPLSTAMEGEFRPGHFSGVAIVVSKLLNLIKPDKAFFGEKDLQQLRIIQCLVKDLGMPVEVVPCATIREKDGLAMSSRNMRLDQEQRKRALALYKYINHAKDSLGKLAHSEIEKVIQKESETEGLVKLEYLTIVDQNTLLACPNVLQAKGVAICIAAYVDEIRLIDNIMVSS
jgi:pantoate--beta-alanine ligase